MTTALALGGAFLLGSACGALLYRAAVRLARENGL
jgi:hypothetical protein